MTSTAANTQDFAAIVAGLNPEDLRAFLQAGQAVLKDVDTQRREELGTLGADFFAEVVKVSPYAESKTSAWAGYTDRQVPVTVDGREYVASFTLTDTKRQSERVEGVDYTPAKKAAKKS